MDLLNSETMGCSVVSQESDFLRADNYVIHQLYNCIQECVLIGWIEKTIDDIVKEETGKRFLEFNDNEMTIFREKIKKFYSYGSSGKVDYNGRKLEYLVYYGFVNFYKIWVPLLKILKGNLLKQQINVADVGCGPGSASLGLVEFYAWLAGLYPDKRFNVHVDLYDGEQKFLEYANKLFCKWSDNVPHNLEISYSCNCTDFSSSIQLSDNYDLIVTSNFLNEFADYKQKFVDIVRFLRDNGKIIVIEPGRKEDSQRINGLRFLGNMEEIFPCNYMISPKCNCWNFCRFHWGEIPAFFEKIALSFVTRKQVPFTYKVFGRGGRIFDPRVTSGNVRLSELGNYVEKRINIDVKICGFYDKEKVDSLKVCDGSFENCGERMCLRSQSVKLNNCKLIGSEILQLRNVLVSTGIFGNPEIVVDDKSCFEILCC